MTWQARNSHDILFLRIDSRQSGVLREPEKDGAKVCESGEKVWKKDSGAPCHFLGGASSPFKRGAEVRRILPVLSSVSPGSATSSILELSKSRSEPRRTIFVAKLTRYWFVKDSFPFQCRCDTVLVWHGRCNIWSKNSSFSRTELPCKMPLQKNEEPIFST